MRGIITNKNLSNLLNPFLIELIEIRILEKIGKKVRIAPIMPKSPKTVRYQFIALYSLLIEPNDPLIPIGS